ncbi:carboxypeptidase O-like isoform X2 [Protopterus annectens]|uniref:carboxypeptidase O-like isoform X2 n=1 Tax=Protopterus annectens TaxID=7888 RepID=UPI001CFB8AF1|nr:carboxypeptidase O-like isoform X2 [Protopterus annectens]
MKSKTKDQVLRIVPQDTIQADFMQNLCKDLMLDLWLPQMSELIRPQSEVHVRVPSSSLNEVKIKLEEKSIQYDIIIENVQNLLEIQTQNVRPRTVKTVLYNYTKYHSMEEIYQWMTDISEKHSEVVTHNFLGMTYEKRPIYYLKIGFSSEKPKKIIWMDCGIHAREWIAPAFCQWFTKEVLQNYKNDPKIERLFKNIDIYMLPVLNIDGYIYTWTTDRLWRKSRSPPPYENCTCYGTDLNRNFDSHWCSIGASSDCCSQTFCGVEPASEPEVKVVADFVTSNKDDILAFLTFHSYGQLILTPYGYTEQPAANHDELMDVAHKAADALKEKHGTEFKVGPSSWVLYKSSGSSRDWVRDVGINFSYTFELRDNGTYGFRLPEEQIQPACEETMAAVKTVINYIHEKHFSTDEASAITDLWSLMIASWALVSSFTLS